MGNSNSTPVDGNGCPTPKGSVDYNNVGTAWSAMRWTALGCTGATVVCSLLLVFQHLRRYRAPKEQRQIIRIVFSNAIYSIIALQCIYWYEDARYIDPLGDLYEAFGLCALFLLFVQYAAPSGTFNEETFAAVKAREETETTFAWPKITWIFVFQFPIVQTLCLVVEEATLTTDHYCPTSLNPKFAHLWLNIIEGVSIGACIISILKFRGHMKGMLAGKRGLVKIVLFKLVVATRFLQQWIFSILLSTGATHVSKEFQYNDILWGIPATLTCVEMVVFSAVFWYAFSPSEYSSKAHPARAMPIWKAIFHALNPTDLVMGMFRVIPLLLHVRQRGDWSRWRAASKEEVESGPTRKAFRALRNRQGQNAAKYYAPHAPHEQMDSHHMRSVTSEPHGEVSAYGRLSPSNLYQPPRGSFPDMRTHLMAEAQAPSREGQWNGQTWESSGRSRSPSPGYMR